MVTAFTFLVALASAPRLEVGRLAVLTLAMASSQASIGWSNDYVDRHKDAVHQWVKPVARGMIDAGVLLPLALAAAILALALAAALGPLPLALMVAGTGCGFTYNLGLKDTAGSWVPYILAFALLPLYAWEAVDADPGHFLGLYLFGPPLVLAIHLGQSAPDIASDRIAGAGGLAASLGRRRTVQAIAACLTLGSLAATLLAALADGDWRIFAPALALDVAMAAAALAAYASAREPAAFRLIVLSATALALGWLAAV